MALRVHIQNIIRDEIDNSISYFIFATTSEPIELIQIISNRKYNKIKQVHF